MSLLDDAYFLKAGKAVRSERHGKGWASYVCMDRSDALVTEIDRRAWYALIDENDSIKPWIRMDAIITRAVAASSGAAFMEWLTA